MYSRMNAQCSRTDAFGCCSARLRYGPASSRSTRPNHRSSSNVLNHQLCTTSSGSPRNASTRGRSSRTAIDRNSSIAERRRSRSGSCRQISRHRSRATAGRMSRRTERASSDPRRPSTYQSTAARSLDSPTIVVTAWEASSDPADSRSSIRAPRSAASRAQSMGPSESAPAVSTPQCRIPARSGLSRRPPDRSVPGRPRGLPTH